jgi:hydrogenase nickel incorporation protein HypB
MPTIPVVQAIMRTNEVLAEEIRRRLDEAGVFGLNLMASPGAGKTTFVEGTIGRLKNRLRLGYVDGDIATVFDAERIAALDVPVVQINTGGDCHLDAAMLGPALDRLPLPDLDLLIVENVGNLICPASFNLGTHLNVLIASLPEGDDKPYKYPPPVSGSRRPDFEQDRPAALPPFRRRAFLAGGRNTQSRRDHFPDIGAARERLG